MENFKISGNNLMSYENASWRKRGLPGKLRKNYSIL